MLSKELNHPTEANDYVVITNYKSFSIGDIIFGCPYYWKEFEDQNIITYTPEEEGIANMVMTYKGSIPRTCVEFIENISYDELGLERDIFKNNYKSSSINNSNPSGFCEMEEDEDYKNPYNKLGRQYDNLKIEPIEYIQQNNLGFCEGSIIKYVSMWKNSKTPLKDLKKAKDYIERLIKRESSS